MKSKRITHAQRYETIQNACLKARELLTQIAHERGLEATLRVDALNAADGLSDALDSIDAYNLSGDPVRAR